MNVYVEYVIIDNFIFDYILLKLTFKGESNPCKKRIFLGCLFSTFFAIIFPFIRLHELILLGLKIVLAFSTVAISGSFTSFKEYFLKVNKFVLLTFLFGGAIYGLFSLVEIDYNFLYGTSDGLFPLGLLLLLGLILYGVCNKLFAKLFQKRLIYPFTCECVLYCKGQILKTKAFLDSGNHLVFNNEYPVCIVSTQLAKRLVLGGFIEGRELGVLAVTTVAGQSRVKIYEIEKMQIYFGDKANIYYNVKIGISEKSLNLSEEFHLILSAHYAPTA